MLEDAARELKCQAAWSRYQRLMPFVSRTGVPGRNRGTARVCKEINLPRWGDCRYGAVVQPLQEPEHAYARIRGTPLAITGSREPKSSGTGCWMHLDTIPDR